MTEIPDPLITIEVEARTHGWDVSREPRPPHGSEMVGQIMVAGRVVWETETMFAAGIPDEAERVASLLRSQCENWLAESLGELLRGPTYGPES